MKKAGNIAIGIVLIAIGIILGGNALGITNINIFFDGWWTMFIIIPCIVEMFNKKDITGNVIGALIGIVLLCCCQGLINFDIIWKLVFPTVLVIIGVSIIFKDTFNSKINKEIKKINKNRKNEEEIYATFSGQTINFDGEEFKGTNLNAVFGGIKCNLKNAIINEDQVINCSSIFGGITIHVADDVKVKIKSQSIFGGVSDDRKNKREIDNAKILYINSTCIFGGVEIK